MEGVTFPKLYYSSEKVLVESFEEGRPMSELLQGIIDDTESACCCCIMNEEGVIKDELIDVDTTSHCVMNNEVIQSTRSEPFDWTNFMFPQETNSRQTSAVENAMENATVVKGCHRDSRGLGRCPKKKLASVLTAGHNINITVPSSDSSDLGSRDINHNIGTTTANVCDHLTKSPTNQKKSPMLSKKIQSEQSNEQSNSDSQSLVVSGGGIPNFSYSSVTASDLEVEKEIEAITKLERKGSAGRWLDVLNHGISGETTAQGETTSLTYYIT